LDDQIRHANSLHNLRHQSVDRGYIDNDPRPVCISWAGQPSGG